MMKKLLIAMLALVSIAVVAAGCGGDKKAAPAADKKVAIKVGATAVPHAEILNHIKAGLAKDGVNMEVIEFSDYVKPNLSLNDKELDANFFQHEPYLNKFVAERKLALVSAGKVHIEPMGIYSKKIKDIKAVPDGAKIAIPNDPTNGGRALAILQSAKLLKLKDGVGVNATVGDITGNDKKLKIVEIEAALLPRSMDDVDLSVINSNFAMEAKLNPVKDSLAIEGSSSAYGNILTVKEGNENTDWAKALKAALESKKVADFISQKYGGAVVSTVDNPTDGFDSSVDYSKLSGTTITVAASPTPHAEILAVAKGILAEKNVKLDVKEFTDYVQPNNVVESGEINANYFQHLPYLEDFNKENNTHIASIATIHVEPMGLYGGKQTTLDAIKK